MNIPETFFKIIETNGCPFYKEGDALSLEGRALTLPPGKPACMVLVEDVKEAVKVFEKPDGTFEQKSPTYRFNCNGPKTECTGIIRMEYRLGGDQHQMDEEKEEKLRNIIQALSKFPIFAGLDEYQLKSLGVFLKYKQSQKGEVIISKGDPGVNLYIMAGGRVEVVGDDNMRIAYLESGEVFGEMSLISGEPVGATVRVVENAKLLYIRGKDFGKIISQFPSIQMYFARLLARRLKESNLARSREPLSGMMGTLCDIPPSELFQALNVNQKTGGIDMTLTQGNARVAFRGGEMIRATYGEKNGKDAFFEILKARDGRFKFTPALRPEEKESPIIADFMWLLMEGVRKIDEDSEES